MRRCTLADAFEPDGMLDSEKNLRVLWVRALLAAAGELNDDVAAELLPSASRWVVGAPLAKTIWTPVLPKLEASIPCAHDERRRRRRRRRREEEEGRGD